MKTGTKSILFGVHQFIWHPITVYLAWLWLNRKFPTFKETICIIIHDWGYWGKENMDDDEGETHPEFGATLAHSWLDKEDDFYHYEFCLYHSRHYARKAKRDPSKLCWADKMSIVYDPAWLYLPRAIASGELKEYRENSAFLISKDESNFAWHKRLKEIFVTLGKEQRGDAVPYMNKGDSDG